MHTQNAPASIIVYHANCLDGAASAWVVAKHLGLDKSPHRADVTYVPYEHFDHDNAEKKILQSITPGVRIYFADVAPEKVFLDQLMLSTASSVTVLDHHKSADERLKKYTPPEGASVMLDMHIDAAKPAAAKMIWDRLIRKEPSPDIFYLIDKMDGDASGLKTPEDFAAAAFADTGNIRTPAAALETLRGFVKKTFNEMAKKGESITTDQNIQIEKCLASATTTSIQLLPGTSPVNVPIVNVDPSFFGRKMSSRMIEMGTQSGAGVAFAWCVENTGSVTLRIRADSTIDASQVAAHLCAVTGATGGGHKGAAAVHFLSLLAFASAIPLNNARITKPIPPRM